MHASCFLKWKQQAYGNRSYAAMSSTGEAIQMVISWATSELGYSALRPNQELVVKHFLLEATRLYRFLQVYSGKSLLPRAFDLLRQQTAVTESIVIVVSPMISLIKWR